MSDSDTAILFTLMNSGEIFEEIEEMLASDKRLKVFMETKDCRVQRDIAESAGVSAGTVSTAINELKGFGLVEDCDEGGYEKTLTSFNHPLIQELFKREYK